MKKEKDSTKSKGILSTILGVFLLVLCIYIVCQVIYGNVTNQPPSIFTLSVSYVPTSSMEPSIKSGNYVLLHQISYDDAKIGDVVVYYSSSENKYIIHRVVGKVSDNNLDMITYDPATSNGLSLAEMQSGITTFYESNLSKGVNNYLITLGDNNYLVDSVMVTSENLFGSYITVLGFMNFLSGGINTMVIFIILIVIFVIMIALQIWGAVIKSKTEQIKKENEQKEKELEKMRNELREEMLKELQNNPDLLNDTTKDKKE